MHEGIIAVLAPQYVDDPRMQYAIALANGEVNQSHCYHDRVVVLLAAHMLEMGDRAGAGGAVSSKSEGGLSVSFGAGDYKGLLGDTGYGREVDRLNRLCYGLTARTAWNVSGCAPGVDRGGVWPWLGE